MRTVDDCPFRKSVSHEVSARFCRFVQTVTGVTDDALCVVERDLCQACCNEPLPSEDDFNHVVASYTFGLTRRIIASGGVSGCDLERAQRVKDFAFTQLPIVAPNEILAGRDDREGEPCLYLGDPTGTVECATCSGNVRRKTYSCIHERHRETTLQRCLHCPDFEAPLVSDSVRTWAVGVTSSPREHATLEKTLNSLKAAGWDNPWLFVEPETEVDRSFEHLNIVRRVRQAGAWPNWLLALTELVMHYPDIDAYMMVQDDVLFARNTREYLESVLWPAHRVGMVSLYCPSHVDEDKTDVGFFRDCSGWKTWGALALVFPNAAARALLRDPGVVSHRNRGPNQGVRNIDSVVGRWCETANMPMYVHTPSLLQHIGETSTLVPSARAAGRRRSKTFVGESFDASRLRPQETAATGGFDDRDCLLVRSCLNHDCSIEKKRTLAPDWLAQRMDVYCRYTLASLKRQSDQGFRIWLDCREGSESELAPYIDELTAAGVEVTFDRGRELLAKIPAVCDSVWVTRIDSDDMFAPDAVALIKKLQGKRRASQFYNGYLYDLQTDRLGYVRLPSPPFYTIRFRRAELRSSEAIASLVPQGHRHVRRKLRPIRLPAGKFCVIRHLANSSSSARSERIESAGDQAQVRGLFGLPTRRRN